MMGLHRAAVCGLVAAEAASASLLGDTELTDIVVGEIAGYASGSGSVSFPSGEDEKSGYGSFASAWKIFRKAAENAEYLLLQVEDRPARWAAIVESLEDVADRLPPHFQVGAEDWLSWYEASSTFGQGSTFADYYSQALAEYSEAERLGEALTPESDEDAVNKVFRHIAQGKALVLAAQKYVEQRHTELFDAKDWTASCPAGVGLGISDGLYGVDWRSKHFDTWPQNSGAFEDGAGWKVEWKGCQWVVSADKSLLPQFSSSSSPCEDNLAAANHLFCQPTEKHRDSICTEVAAAGLCESGKTNHALVRAVCPVSCSRPASECTKDAHDAAKDMAAIWNLNGVTTCKDLVLQEPAERIVVPVICRFTSVRTLFSIQSTKVQSSNVFHVRIFQRCKFHTLIRNNLIHPKSQSDAKLLRFSVFCICLKIQQLIVVSRVTSTT